MKNKLVLFTGPSGVGKSTIENYLFNDSELKLKLSCSATTRKPRNGEKNGNHYFFISEEEFDKKIANHEFLEWNAHFSNKYGTLKSEIQKILDSGYQPFLELETFGAKNVMQEYGEENIISIFLAPPSIEELKFRIINRGTENTEQIHERMTKVEEEMSQKRHFQHIVINHDVKQAISEIKKIILENR